MSTTAPLQYESLKMVIQYLEPNLRFKLAQHIPSLRRTEKIVPLKLFSLAFSKTGMNINDTNYRTRVYLDYQNENEAPLCHQISNEEGGTQFDLYRWGTDTASGKDMILPGYLHIPGNRFYPWWNTVGAPGPEFYERQLRAYKTALVRRLHLGAQPVVLPKSLPIPRVWTFQANFWNLPAGLDIAEIERNDVECIETAGLSIGCLQYNIHCLETHLHLLHCQQNNIQLPCTPRIHLTVDSPEGKQIYRYDYSMKLSTAFKNLASRLLSGRRHVIDVWILDTAHYDLTDHSPIDFKVRIKNLRVRDLVEYYEAVKHKIDKSSHPLECLSICSFIHDSFRVFDLEILKSAKRLFVQSFPLLPEYSAVFMKFENPLVEMDFEVPMFALQDQINFIRNWMQVGRSVGATFSYQVRTIDGLMAQIREQLPGSIIRENTALLQMSSVVVTCRESINDFGVLTWTVQLQAIKNPNRMR